MSSSWRGARGSLEGTLRDALIDRRLRAGSSSGQRGTGLAGERGVMEARESRYHEERAKTRGGLREPLTSPLRERNLPTGRMSASTRTRLGVPATVAVRLPLRLLGLTSIRTRGPVI